MVSYVLIALAIMVLLTWHSFYLTIFHGNPSNPVVFAVSSWAKQVLSHVVLQISWVQYRRNDPTGFNDFGHADGFIL